MDLPFSYKVDGTLQIVQVDNTATVSKEGGREGGREGGQQEGREVNGLMDVGCVSLLSETLTLTLMHPPSLPPSLRPSFSPFLL
jgi:hypothetical protein